MGMEYRLRFEAPDREAVEALLRRLPHVTQVNQPISRFDFGVRGQERAQASVHWEPGGLYFCDHCAGEGPALLGKLVASLTSALGPITIEEL